MRTAGTAFSMQTEIFIAIGSGSSEYIYDVWVDYTYTPGMAAYTPRGEYGPIDPPEPAEVDVIAARWRRHANPDVTYEECPGWIVKMLSDDEDFLESLIVDAESSSQPDPDYLYEMSRDEPDEAQEWRDYDPDC